MELAVQLEELGSVLSLSWVPREQNVPADALTNEDFNGFDPRKRVSVDVTELGFKILPRLMDAATHLDGEIRLVKEQKRSQRCVASAGQAKSCKAPLHQSDPW